jgi:hypothetical protein
MIARPTKAWRPRLAGELQCGAFTRFYCAAEGGTGLIRGAFWGWPPEIAFWGDSSVGQSRPEATRLTTTRPTKGCQDFFAVANGYATSCSVRQIHREVSA